MIDKVWISPFDDKESIVEVSNTITVEDGVFENERSISKPDHIERTPINSGTVHDWRTSLVKEFFGVFTIETAPWLVMTVAVISMVVIVWLLR